MHHFGEPLVSSTADFGTRSEPPTHPELLDWLASDFIRSGWSVKHLHRVIILSSAYQQGSFDSQPAPVPAKVEDPENRLLAHFSRRRLEFEAMRDSLLFISGQLDPTMGGRSVDLASEPLCRCRAVYLLVNRQDLPATFRAFDFAVPDQCVERRPRTTVPQQALFAMNSPFVLEQARALAARPELVAASEPAKRVEEFFKHVLGRYPSKSEVASALRFIEEAKADAQSDAGLTAWEQFAQVMLISNEAIFLD